MQPFSSTDTLIDMLGLIWFDFIPYQLLLVMSCQIPYIYISCSFSNNPFWYKYSFFFIYIQLNVKTDRFQTIQPGISAQFSSLWPIDRTPSGATTPDQCGPGAMPMKGYSAFYKAPELLSLYIRFFSIRTFVRGVLPLCKGAVSYRYVSNQFQVYL